MPPAIRKDKDYVLGGLLLDGSPDVIINTYPAVRIGDRARPDGVHPVPVMIEGSETVFVNNIKVCRFQDHADCGHIAHPGSPNVIIGGKATRA